LGCSPKRQSIIVAHFTTELELIDDFEVSGFLGRNDRHAWSIILSNVAIKRRTQLVPNYSKTVVSSFARELHSIVWDEL